MARRETTVTITREGRDQGKTYTLREMPAAQAEEWFYRAMMLLARSGADVPPDIFQQGAIGFATMGLGTVLTGLGKAPWHEVKPLLDEMLPCVVALASPAGVPITGRTDIDADRGTSYASSSFARRCFPCTWIFQSPLACPITQRWQRR